MRKRLKVLVLTVILALSMMPMNVCAAEGTTMQLLPGHSDLSGATEIYQGIHNFVGNPNVRAEAITGAILTVGKTDEGLHIEVTTSTNAKASEIGVTDLIVQRKKLLGWRTMATTSGSAKDADVYMAQLTYPDFEPGDEFRVLCTHFAELSDGRHVVENVSTTITF